jgi:hypothetical protein
MTNPTLHPGWQSLRRLPPRMVPCPRCKAAFPDNEARYWRWAPHDEQWLCRRRACMAADRPAPYDETTAWEDEVIADVDKLSRQERVLRELGL